MTADQKLELDQLATRVGLQPDDPFMTISWLRDQTYYDACAKYEALIPEVVTPTYAHKGILTWLLRQTLRFATWLALYNQRKVSEANPIYTTKVDYSIMLAEANLWFVAPEDKLRELLIDELATNEMDLD